MRKENERPAAAPALVNACASTVGRRFIQGAAWSLAGTVAAQGLALLASVVVARFLGREEFGRFEMVNGTVLMMGVFAGMGFGLTATKFIAQYRAADPDRAGRILGMALTFTILGAVLAALLLLVFADTLASKTLNAPGLETPLRVASGVLLFTTLGGMLNGALAGFESFRAIAGVNLFRGVVVFPAVWVFAWHWGLTGAVLAQVLTGMVWCGAAWIILRRQIQRFGLKIRWGGLRGDLPILWQFSFPALLGGVLVTPALWGANALLANCPSGWSDLGLLGVANQWRNVLMLLPTIFTNVTLPMIAAGIETESLLHTERVMEISQSLATLSVVPAVAALVFGSGLILHCYGRDFTSGAPLFALMTGGVGLAGVGNAGSAAIQAHGKMWLAVVMNLSWSTVYVAFVAVFVNHWGGMALAAGFLVAYALLMVWGYAYIYRNRLISRGMLTRTLGASAFIGAMAVASVIVPSGWRLALFFPVLALSLALSFGLWIDKTLRQRIIDTVRKRVRC